MNEILYHSQAFTLVGGFTPSIEGPACDKEGNIYAVNFHHRHTIGKVTPEGEACIFLELPNGSTGNGIRFSRNGDMFIADYTNHNILKVDMVTRAISIHAHEPRMHQPNDIAITGEDVLFASDPDWSTASGQLWRIDGTGKTTLLEHGMGTTNGVEVSCDDKTLYVNETIQRRIWAYDLSPSGNISNKRLFHEFADYGLDGMRGDIAGNLYVTRIGNGTIAVLSPEGKLLREVQLIGKDCTNLTFGGIDGRTCYVTISDKGNIETFRTETAGRCWSLLGTV